MCDFLTLFCQNSIMIKHPPEPPSPPYCLGQHSESHAFKCILEFPFEFVPNQKFAKTESTLEQRLLGRRYVCMVRIFTLVTIITWKRRKVWFLEYPLHFN